MLVTLKEILHIAERENYAAGAFNTPNLECLLAVIRNAEELNVPVIISHAELHEQVAPLADIGPVMVFMAKEAKIPVCVHLDHGETLEYLQEALDMGFTSIMYDGSLLSYEENVANTKKAVGMTTKTGASVEAEIGVLGGREAGAKQARLWNISGIITGKGYGCRMPYRRTGLSSAKNGAAFWQRIIFWWEFLWMVHRKAMIPAGMTDWETAHIKE